MSLGLDQVKNIPVIPISKIVESIKNKEFKSASKSPEIQDDANSNVHTSTLVRAKEIVQNDGISFSCKLGTFMVRGTNQAYHCVTLYPKK